MPNRMFDPVANPFAIQNLLEKKVENFVAQPDERADAGFAFDPVMMANPGHAFAERTIVDPSASDTQGFQAEWMDAGEVGAGHEFSNESQEVAGDFVAGQSPAAAGFQADAGEAGSELSAATEFAASDSESGAVTSESREPTQASAAPDAVAATDTEGLSADTATASAASADAKAAESAHAVSDAAKADSTDDENAVTPAELLADPAASSESAAGQDADTVTTAVATDVADPAADNTVQTSGAEPVQAVAAPEAIPVVAQSGISDEELQARLEAAREEGRAEVRETVRAEAHQQGYDEGEAAGYAKAREALDKEYENKHAQLQSMIDAMQALSYNPDAMFEPMKQLSMHLAEQLVRGELSQSPQAIARLVDNCLRELNASGEKPVIIHLHPEDIDQYKPEAAQFGDALVLRADPRLERGSVRASLEGSVVEDLMQRRVAGLKKGLAQAPAPSWRANAGRLSDRIADGQRGSLQVDDVTVATARKQAEAKSEAVAEHTSDHQDSVAEASAASAGNADA
jgi:flagellar biosynthesis/type III secretory pathway protein FliH